MTEHFLSRLPFGARCPWIAIIAISAALSACSDYGAVVGEPSPLAGPVEGQATVIDGDTLSIGGHRLDLAGIDAPEVGQTCDWPNKEIACGEIATGALKDLTTAARVDCEPAALSAEGNPAARCAVDGYDLSRNMVHTGWAVVAPDGPSSLRPVQAEAQAERRGMWKGTFAWPWEWRGGEDGS